MRRDLIKRHLYLVPNSIVVSRGCPHHCDSCYQDAFFEGGRSFCTRAVDDALAEIDRLPGHHLIMTPCPSTGPWRQLESENRIVHRDRDLYDTRHVVYRPRGMTPRQLEDGYRRAYRDSSRWSRIRRGSAARPGRPERMRHLAYAGGRKKFEPAWDLLIRSGRVVRALPVLERTPAAFGGRG
ncbi:hypothetical protein SUDANB15_06393 [Streptomyces sp. enrichment culture]|uniref:hypothetical protein n=1 Tax=Streptomyces sp. enrichment culture TaxID=1795815 RepID=UPI003F578896